MFLRNLTIRSRFFILYVVTILLWLCIAFILYSYLISNRAWQLNCTIETGYDSRSQYEELKNQIRFASGILTEDASAMDLLFKTDLNSRNRKIEISMALIVIFTITVFLTLIYNITRSVKEPLDQVNSYIKALVRGSLPDKLTVEGLAKFEEILRIHSSHIESLADQIIQNLVRYLNAGAGALFLTNTENENQLEMAAVFTFDRKKYVERSFLLGEGLVGTCAIEKQRIFLTEIPENYIQITSGLGNSKPRSLLLIPLKLENEVLGVIEIASLKILEEHEINFVETIGESIASAISGVRMNMRTIDLLEQSQKQAREMAEQEEKMRQYMVEFESNRKEAARKETEISGILMPFKYLPLLLNTTPGYG